MYCINCILDRNVSYDHRQLHLLLFTIIFYVCIYKLHRLVPSEDFVIYMDYPLVCMDFQFPLFLKLQQLRQSFRKILVFF